MLKGWVRVEVEVEVVAVLECRLQHLVVAEMAALMSEVVAVAVRALAMALQATPPLLFDAKLRPAMPLPASWLYRSFLEEWQSILLGTIIPRMDWSFRNCFAYCVGRR